MVVFTLQTSNVPFNFYDHVAVLFPGTILLGYITTFLDFLFPNFLTFIREINELSTVLLILFFLITAFILGHISYSISKSFFEFKIFKPSPRNTDAFLGFSRVKQEEIISGAGEIYGENIKEELKVKLNLYISGRISGKELGIKNYCFAAVAQHKESKHDMFVALADFLRSTAFLLFIGTIILIVVGFYKFFSLEDYNFFSLQKWKFLITALIPGISATLLLNRSFRMRRAADSIIYSQFLYSSKLKDN